MDLGRLVTVTDSILANLQNTELKDMVGKSKLESLQETALTVMSVLREAEANGDLSSEQKKWIENLKKSLYEADNSLDEYVTFARRQQQQQQQQRIGSTDSHNFVTKGKACVSFCFSPNDNAYKRFQRFEKVWNKLDETIKDHPKFDFVTYGQYASRRRREETCSYVYKSDIIGREEDREWIVSTLLEPSHSWNQDVYFLSIVGIGGLGKTTLAQLVYNDERVRKEFPLRLWVCVADVKFPLDEIAVMRKILESDTGEKAEDLPIEELQGNLNKRLSGKKYLLVLDDVWTEDLGEWRSLAALLIKGRRGSWVIVTTRSGETARIVGDNTYELKGLSDEASWHLFMTVALGSNDEHKDPSELVEIGQDTVKKCANVPLAIKVVGRLLFGQDISKWLTMQRGTWAELRNFAVIESLKLSYDRLQSPIKSCFCYCAVFPKEFKIQKVTLIRLWMAQGYIVPTSAGQSLEDAGEEYFTILLMRGFLTDIEADEYGEIISCKLHLLMSYLAQSVAGEEIGEATPLTNQVTPSQVRSVLQLSPIEVGFSKFRVSLKNFTFTRALYLPDIHFQSLPETIAELPHLRYLDLSRNHLLEVLPESLTVLHNLQTIVLQKCQSLRALPKDFSKLDNLVILDIKGCSSLVCMPSGMGNLLCLYTLNMFVLSEPNSRSMLCLNDQLEDLKALANLKGSLKIRITAPKSTVYVRENGRGDYLRSKQLLKSVKYVWNCKEVVDYHEALLEDLQPHPNLRELGLKSYGGKRLPTWLREDSKPAFLPNLVFVSIGYCPGLQSLSSSLGKLRYLKKITLCMLENLEYIENAGCSNNDMLASTSGSKAAESFFFPSLEELILIDLPELKGWWKKLQVGRNQLVDTSCENNSISRVEHILPSFPRLLHLKIVTCPRLTCIPFCPSVEILRLENINKKLVVISKESGEEAGVSVSTSSSFPKLRSVHTNVGCLKSNLPLEAFKCLDEMSLSADHNIESLGELGETFQTCSATLRSLRISNCSQLKSLSGGLEHLTALEMLEIGDAPVLSIDNQSLPHCLRTLKLQDLPRLVNLPESFRNLTALQSLCIINCQNMEALPEWIGQLSSLRSLEIKQCKSLDCLPETLREVTSLEILIIKNCSAILKERCHIPTGEYWPSIQHIYYVEISDDQD